MNGSSGDAKTKSGSGGIVSVGATAITASSSVTSGAGVSLGSIVGTSSAAENHAQNGRPEEPPDRFAP